MINTYNQDSGMCRFVSDNKLKKNGVAKIPHAPFSGDEAILVAIEYSKEKGHHVVSYF